MATIEKALEIALKAHQSQVDKAGQPYILHPISVMQKGKTMDEKIVGILHDVVEDSNITLENLASEGFSNEIIEAVNALTKRPNENYEDFIQRALKNKLARKVKIYDITDNLNISRLSKINTNDTKRLNKYLKALEILKEKC